MAAAWPSEGSRFVVSAGGAPLLQMNEALVAAPQARSFQVAVETNGSIAPAPAGIDWICDRPKAGASHAIGPDR